MLFKSFVMSWLCRRKQSVAPVNRSLSLEFIIVQIYSCHHHLKPVHSCATRLTLVQVVLLNGVWVRHFMSGDSVSLLFR